MCQRTVQRVLLFSRDRTSSDWSERALSLRHVLDHTGDGYDSTIFTCVPAFTASIGQRGSVCISTLHEPRRTALKMPPNEGMESVDGGSQCGD